MAKRRSSKQPDPLDDPRKLHGLVKTLEHLPPWYDDSDDAIESFAAHLGVPVWTVYARLAAHRHDTNRSLH